MRMGKQEVIEAERKQWNRIAMPAVQLLGSALCSAEYNQLGGTGTEHPAVVRDSGVESVMVGRKPALAW